MSQARKRAKEEIESVRKKMASFIESNGRPRDMADRVAAILAELDGVRVHLTEIAEEEKKVDGYSSGTLTNMVRQARIFFHGGSSIA